MAEHLWDRFSLYINVENFLDARQTCWDTTYTGNVQACNFMMFMRLWVDL